MELGIFFDHLLEASRQERMTLEQVGCFAAKQGISYVDIDGAFWMGNERRVDEFLQRTGLKVGSVDGRFDLAHGKEAEGAEALIRFAAKREVGQVLLIPGYVKIGESREEIMERIAEHLRPLAHVAVGLHVQCTLEDYDDEIAPYGTWQELKWFLERVNGLGISFDTGNFAFFGQDAREALRELLPWVRMVHCKDRSNHSLAGEIGRKSACGEILYPCAVGEGHIPMDELIDTLACAGFDGGLTIEHFDSNRQMEAMKNSAANLNHLLSKL